MTRMVVALVLCVAAACGGDLDESEEVETTFACETDTCDSAAGEFCWLQLYGSGETSAFECFVPASACTTCACAEQAVADRLDGANNCSGVTECKQDGDAITYTCVNPSL